MKDPLDTVSEKVDAIFQQMAGDLADRLDGSKIAEPAMSIIAAAFAAEYGQEKAADLAFHMADWNSDAAFIVALHLFPEQFTSEEITAGVGLFLAHAPNHIRAACGITETYVWEYFPDAKENGSATTEGSEDGG